jgi:ribosomal-protein-alanine acetyltransferase
MGTVLQEAGAEAAASLAKIHQESFIRHWNTDDFRESLIVEGTHALLALSPDPVGMILYRIMHEQSEILTMAVVPGRRRQGIARRLLAQAMAEVKKHGAMGMFLEVDAGNVAAQKLYESGGFTVSGRRKGYYRQPDGSFTDALVMRAELA